MHVLEKMKSPLDVVAESVIDQYAANFWLQKINPLWSFTEALGKIVKKETPAQDMVSLTFQFNRHFDVGQAGQHHPLFVNVKGIRYERSYSLTQIDERHVLLTVKKVEQGKVSSWLVEQSQVGDVLEFGQPYGDMLLPEPAKPMILLAAGSGITPMLSLLNALSKTERMTQAPIHLLYWVSKYTDVAFQARFEAWAAQYPHFSFQVFYTQEHAAGERLNSQHLTLLSQIDNSVVYACGPSGFVTQAEQLFSHAQSFKSEAFSMTPVENSELGFVNVTLLKSQKILTIPKGQSILTSLEQQNIKPTHGCRMGICNKCVCTKAEGSTKNLVNGSQNSEPGNMLKICVNSAQSDLVIDL
jgi:ferredoxin-NADP reductase